MRHDGKYVLMAAAVFDDGTGTIRKVYEGTHDQCALVQDMTESPAISDGLDMDEVAEIHTIIVPQAKWGILLDKFLKPEGEGAWHNERIT